MNIITDQTITCRDCHKEFVFTVEEQERYEACRLVTPKRCRECRRKKTPQYRVGLELVGTVKRFYEGKGYGFIEVSGHPDYYVNHSAIQGQGEWKSLSPGQRVRFTTAEGKENRPMAVDVWVVE